MIFEPTILVQNISHLSRKNQSDILNKESAVHSSSGVDTKTFHIKIIFEVMEVLFNGVFSTVDLEGFDGVLDVVRDQDKETGRVFLAAMNGILVVGNLAAAFGGILDGKKRVIILLVILGKVAGEEFVIFEKEFMEEFFLISSSLKRVKTGMQITSVALPLDTFRIRIEFVSQDATVMAEGKHFLAAVTFCRL